MEVGNVVFSHVVQQGYVKADGQELYRGNFAALFAFAQQNNLLVSEEAWSNGMQGMYSIGDGEMTFRIPDLRGQFIRALDEGRGLDLDRNLGSQQGDAIRNISGILYASDHDFRVDNNTANNLFRAGSTRRSYYRETQQISEGCSYVVFDASKVVSTASENRPKNIALIAQIKY